MKEILIAFGLVFVVAVVTVFVQLAVKNFKRNHKKGLIVIPVTNETEDVDHAVKSAYFDETFDSTPCAREILLVNFGCCPQLWEHYQKLSSDYNIVHAIESYELCAYIKAKYINRL